jgi:hypothetical protein
MTRGEFLKIWREAIERARSAPRTLVWSRWAR